MLLLLKIQNHWGISVCCFFSDTAVIFCKLTNAQVGAFEMGRDGDTWHLLVHWSLLFAVRRVCTELHWYLCWGVTWVFGFDLALVDPAYLSPYPGFWGNLLTLMKSRKHCNIGFIKLTGAPSTLISHFFMRFVLVLLTCHQVGHDSNLASAVINAGASLQRGYF